MMKYLLALMMVAFATVVRAAETVPIYWPFSPAGTHASMVRTIADEMNQLQKDYIFVFVHKPGAGGSIGANALAESKTPTLMVVSSSFFIRPNIYPESSYDLSRFRNLGAFCKDQPVALMSAKYKTLDELRNKTINIGVIPGSITHLTVIALQKTKMFDFNVIFYPGTPEITKDVVGGHLDVSVDFLSSVEQFAGRINVLGITGSVSHGSAKTFSSNNVPSVGKISMATHMIFSANADEKFIKNVRLIWPKVLQSTKLKEFCEKEYGAIVPEPLTESEADQQFRQQRNFWKEQSQGVIIQK